MNGEAEFTTTVDAALADDGVWIIDARIVYRDGVVPPVGTELLGRASVALLEKIIVAAAMPMATDSTDVSVNNGLRASSRNALRTSSDSSDAVLGMEVRQPTLRLW